ncbi:MAG: DUF4304 domain-containing protein [Flavobacterium sp.]
MKKKELESILSEMLVPIGFKKKGNYWVINGDVITKMINLQKSNYNNGFYINYGYILNSIPLSNLMMHVYNRVTSLDVEEINRITFLLDLESNISDQERIRALKEMLQRNLIVKVQTVNTEEDLINELKNRPHLNDVPLDVKKHLNLIE